MVKTKNFRLITAGTAVLYGQEARPYSFWTLAIVNQATHPLLIKCLAEKPVIFHRNRGF